MMVCFLESLCFEGPLKRVQTHLCPDVLVVSAMLPIPSNPAKDPDLLVNIAISPYDEFNMDLTWMGTPTYRHHFTIDCVMMDISP